MRVRPSVRGIACVALLTIGVRGTSNAQTTPADPVVARAKGDIEHGRYAEALKTLTGAASANPESEAPLQLGLLQLYLGRRTDAGRTLQAVIDRDGDADNPAALLRAGLAARALGHFE